MLSWAASDLSRVVCSHLGLGGRVCFFCFLFFCLFFFLFQAEDGIRDLVRSRGLGDVYKRQLLSVRPGITSPASVLYRDEETMLQAGNVVDQYLKVIPVSYTHLTLPTSDLV